MEEARMLGMDRGWWAERKEGVARLEFRPPPRPPPRGALSVATERQVDGPAWSHTTCWSP